MRGLGTVTARVRPVLAARVRPYLAAPYVVAFLSAVLIGLIGAAAGQFLGWRAAGPLPTDSEAAAIADLALGGPAPEAERRDELFGVDRHGNYEPGYVRFTVPVDPASAALPWQVKDIRVRLDTAGWEVDRTWAGAGPDAERDRPGPTAQRVAGLQFVADKGDWRVRFTVGPGAVAHLDIVRAEPVTAPLGAAAGGLLGAAAGAILGYRSTRRSTVDRPGRRVARVLALGGGAAVLPGVGVTVARQVIGQLQLGRPQLPLWAVGPALQALTLIGLFALAAAVAVLTSVRARG